MSTEKRPQRRTPSPSLKAYLAAVLAAGAAVLVLSGIDAFRAPHPLGWLALGAMALVAGSIGVNFAGVPAHISISDTFHIIIALMWGPGPAALAIAASGAATSIRRRLPVHQLAFNAASLGLSMWTAARVFFAVTGIAPLLQQPSPIGVMVAPLLLLTLIYFSLNSGLTAVAVGLDSRQSPVGIWRRHFMWLSVSYLAAASVAFCLILVIQQVGITAAVVVLPLLAVFHLTLRSSFGRLEDAQKHLGTLDRLYLSTVETLAMAIDAKDDVTHSHVRRVQAYAVGLAEALGITADEEIKAIKAAALLHDTGKLAVPEHILNKPGKLTESEFETMKLHVDVGADILSLVEFPYPVVPIVRCHHENWDGSGYPRGVKGEAIPIGARILSVVDCFDALTSDRPYRRAMTEEDALKILHERSGTMYDPHVVETFTRVYQTIDTGEAHETAEQIDVLRRINESRTEKADKKAPETTASASTTQTSASADVLAFVSLARLASGDGSVADVLALSSNLIWDIMPDVTGAWYLPDSGRTKLMVAEAFGPAAHLLQGVQCGVGQKLTGWVAASRQAIVNSDAALDLDTPSGLRTCMSVPLMAGDALIGVLSLYSPAADAFDENRGRLLQMLAPHMATAIQAAVRHTGSNVNAADKATGTLGRDLRLVSNRPS